MKKSIFLSMLLIIILAAIVYSGSGSYTTTEIWVYQEDADQTNFTGSSDNTGLYNHSAFTDGDWDTYALVNGTFYRNYTKKTDYTYLSLWQNKYNVSRGEINVNHSIPSACWDYNESKIILKVNTTNESNARYCNDGSWELIGSIKDRQAVYEEAMNFRTVGRTYTISYNTDKPAEYVTFDNSAVNFSIYINDSLADANHTTFNVSIYIRLNNTAGYTANVSDLVIVNGSFVNATINFNDGDRVWWYWSAEDNYSRNIFNTSVRIFDVDLVYYKLSLGANKVINFSTDTGEMVIKGGLAADNITVDWIKINQNDSTTNPLITCDNDHRGYIYYNNNTNHHYGCNSTDWNALW